MTSLPCKIYLLCAGLTVGGLIFLVWGLVDIFILKEVERGIGFSVLGGIMLITGIYYDLKLVAYKLAETEDEKQIILNEFPID